MERGEELAVFDELGYCVAETLRLYRENVVANNFERANQCLDVVGRLTIQMHNIEDHVSPAQYKYGSDVSSKEIDYAVTKAKIDGDVINYLP